MSLYRLISVSMIISQIGLVPLVRAQVVPAQVEPTQVGATITTTPELDLLRNVITLQGLKLTSDQFEKDVSDVVSQYLATAPSSGQQERLQQALVDLGVYTAEQA